MTESVDDNIVPVDKLVYMINHDDQILASDTDNDNDDLHVCRKCNKVFRNLAEYLEHKVKYENYSISQTISKWDHNMVLPQLVQKKKENEEETVTAGKTKAEIFKKPEDMKSSTPTLTGDAICVLPLDKSSWKETSVSELKQDNFIHDQAAKKRGRKRKSLVPDTRSSHSDIEIMYTCTVCDKKFRRKATLRWHMKYDHAEDLNDEPVGKAATENDGNLSVEIEKVENYDHISEENEHKTPVEFRDVQEHNLDNLETTEELQNRDISSQSCKEPKHDKVARDKDLDRPYVCIVCGRRFKKMTALKTHGAVHSDERKYVCAVKNCPYGFKLKGGLVRHMRRHTGERPYICENCGRSFSESGALTRHMKTRQNCARRPGSAYPRYMKNWTHHPNIPAVIDPSQRDLHHGRSKVFNDLVEYQECKVENEDCSISQTESWAQPLLTQNKKVKNERADDTRENTNVDIPKSKGINSLRRVSMVDIDGELSLDKSFGKEESAAKLTEDSLMQNQVAKKRGRKKKCVDSEILQTQPELEMIYMCSVCDQKFTWEATLRRHMKYEHKGDKENSENSVDESGVEVSAENDVNFRVEIEKEENDDHHFEEDEHKTPLEIHVIIQHNKDRFETTGDLQDKDVSCQSNKHPAIKYDKLTKGKDRPYMCDICGRRFKKMTALKTHGAVHSDERKYVCAVKNCPYGFKLKGGLVRHMRRHTGERPYICDNCGRAFSESGALTRHMKSRRNCARTPDSAYHRYRTNWTYHPNIPAVIDPIQRSVSPGQNTFQHPEWDSRIRTDHDTNDIIMAGSSEVLSEIMKPLDKYTDITDTSTQEHTEVDSSHIVELVDLNSSTEVEFLKLLQCCVCRMDLGTVEGLEIHLRSHLADQPARCGFCHFLSHDQEELRHHILSMHYDSLKDIEASVMSMEESDGGVKNEATQERRNTRRDALIAVKQLYHLKKQKPATEVEKDRSSSGKLQCMVCNRFFGLRSYLVQHMRTHTGDRPHQCHVCHRSFTSRDILKKHMYVHKDQRDFKCDECGKLFKRLTYVQQHLKIHNQERTIKCSLCDKLFRTQFTCEHTRINPYKCHVCNKYFRERGSLRRHMRLHAGEKPYICHLCNRAFAENGTLSRHLKAKVPCSIKHSKNSITQLGHNQVSSNMLTQFSTVVANTQHYIQNVDIGQQFMLPSMHEGQETETLHIFESDISESVIIVTERSIVDLIREKQITIESGEAAC